MSATDYNQLALDWQPESASDTNFKLITGITLVVALIFAVVMTAIDVPEPDRKTRAIVPERIANFILENKEKPKPEVVKPKAIAKPILQPKPKPEAKIEPKPQVKKIPKNLEKRKPLTDTQKKARERAASSGLLALSSELADLMDTSDISAMIAGNVKTTVASPEKVAAINKDLLTAGISKGSGGVNAGDFTTTIVSKTQLSQREITQITRPVISQVVQTKAKDVKAKNRPRTGEVRAEEDITIVFDQNKSKLHSVYNRARRTNPGLKGKIVLEITIAPSGKVTNVTIISSELGDTKLESRLLNRIKQFNFGEKDVAEVTVTYPIEFLPS